MNNYVADTMALIIRLEKRKLPLKTKFIFESAETGQIKIFIPSMAIAELAYLSQKSTVTASLQDVKKYLSKFENIEVKPMDFEIINCSFEISDIRELHDRLISGTARYMNLELITNDPVIESSRYISTVWN